MTRHDRFRVGDILAVACPFTETEVSGIRPGYVAVKWPWHRSDPETPQFHWDGQWSVASDPTHHDWKRELFRIDPAPRHLRVGAPRRVGIPLTVVQVTRVVLFDPPLANGLLPRPAVLLGVLPAGQTEDPEIEDQSCTINPDDDLPMDIDVLFRPYAFLRLGDEISDSDGRPWRFNGPWRWERLDDGVAGAPAWPLRLTERLEGFDLADASAVDDATVTGSHGDELDRWVRLAGADPAPGLGS